MNSATGDSSAGPRSSDDVEVAVIGAGQAGLTMGYFLVRQGRRFVIVERADSIGSAWRERWESLTLFTPRRYSALPGLPFPGDPDGYPSRDEVIVYLQRYAETFELPIERNSEVKKLEHGDGGRFRLELGARTITADQVVVAMANYAKSGFLGSFTDLLTKFSAAPSPGLELPSPFEWGDVDEVRRRFSGRTSSLRLERGSVTFSFPSLDEGWAVWERTNPPLLALKSMLPAEHYQELAEQGKRLMREMNAAGNGRLVLDSEYLQVVARKAPSTG